MNTLYKHNNLVYSGPIPSHNQLKKVSECGFKSVVDLRSSIEKYDNSVRLFCTLNGVIYFDIDIDKKVTIEDALMLYLFVFDKGNNPTLVFSKKGTRSFMMLNVFDAISKNKPLSSVLDDFDSYFKTTVDDEGARDFLTEVSTTPSLQDMIRKIQQLRIHQILKIYNSPQKSNNVKWLDV